MEAVHSSTLHLIVHDFSQMSSAEEWAALLLGAIMEVGFGVGFGGNVGKGVGKFLVGKFGWRMVVGI
jgi:hypothetical protein